MGELDDKKELLENNFERSFVIVPRCQLTMIAPGCVLRHPINISFLRTEKSSLQRSTSSSPVISSCTNCSTASVKPGHLRNRGIVRGRASGGLDMFVGGAAKYCGYAERD